MTTGTTVTSPRKAAPAAGWMAGGTATFLACVDRIGDDALVAPTALAGWTRRHLVAHVAANAVAMARLVRWARTGDQSPMYSSPQQRQDEIEAGSQLPPAELRGWVHSSAQSLAADMGELSETNWNRSVVTAQGRTVPATELPWMRSREVMVHAVDLGVGTTFADLPADFLTALVDDVVAKRSAGANGPALVVRVPESGASWQVFGTGDPLVVAGSLADVVTWLTGRPSPQFHTQDGAPVPVLPAWL